MGNLLHSLNNGGPVEYTPNRVLIHFGSPQGTGSTQIAADRLRKNGFILSTGSDS